MKCLVTGAAGFIGSHLSKRLLEDGYRVIGIDSFIDFYPRWIKEKNLNSLIRNPHFEFIEADINRFDLPLLIRNIDCIFHLAAQAGVRSSWGKNFSQYIQSNIESTQKLLEAAKMENVKKFIYASSSSVYGLCQQLPMTENSPLLPYSPYGVTKLAGENLVSLYFNNFGVPCISLRYFTVYGPGQRPDMAFHKFFKSIMGEKKISIYGNGTQTRDFTYIDDITNAHILVLKKGKEGEIYNVGGGTRIQLQEVISLIKDITGDRVKVECLDPQKGDVLHTFANIDKARIELGYSPQTTLEYGLKKEWEWLRSLYRDQQENSIYEDIK